MTEGRTQNGRHTASHQPTVSGSPSGPTVRRTEPGPTSSSLLTAPILSDAPRSSRACSRVAGW